MISGNYSLVDSGSFKSSTPRDPQHTAINSRLFPNNPLGICTFYLVKFFHSKNMLPWWYNNSRFTCYLINDNIRDYVINEWLNLLYQKFKYYNNFADQIYLQKMLCST